MRPAAPATPVSDGHGRPAVVLSLLVMIVFGYAILRPLHDARRVWSTDEAMPV